MYNPENYTQSTRTSSVAYSKTFERIGLTLSSSFNLSQSIQDSSLSMTLPSLDITLARFYPFKRKKAAGKEKWYEKDCFKLYRKLEQQHRYERRLVVQVQSD